jgi:hypothetical protein
LNCCILRPTEISLQNIIPFLKVEKFKEISKSKSKFITFSLLFVVDTTVILPIDLDDYIQMASDACINVYFKAKVTETGQVFSGINTVEFIKPELEADVSMRYSRN